MLFSIDAPADNDRGPQFAESIFAALHESCPQRCWATFEIRSSRGNVGFYFQAPAQLRSIVTEQFRDAYPGCRVTDQTESHESIHEIRATAAMELRLTPDTMPLRTFTEFQERFTDSVHDPLTAVLSALRASRGNQVTARVALQVRPAPRRRCHEAEIAHVHLQRQFLCPLLRRLYAKCSTSRHWPTRLFAGIVSRLTVSHSSPGEPSRKLSQHLFDVHLQIIVNAPGDRLEFARKQLAEIAATYGQFTSQSIWFSARRIRRVTDRPRGRGFLLAADELATLWHPPIADVRVARLQRAQFHELEPPAVVPSKKKESGVLTLGRVKFRNQRNQFGILPDDRRRHLYVIGKTGMGKTTLLQNILAEDIAAGRGVAVIDPHGDLADNVLNLVPKSRTNDIVLFSPADPTHAIAFNPLTVSDGRDPILVADAVLTVFQKVFGLDESQAPRMMHILRNSLLTLVETPGTTLLSLNRILREQSFRDSLATRVSNPAVRDFWQNEFGRWKAADQVAFVASLQNKLGAFLTNPKLQWILGQPDSRIDLRRIMDTGGVLVVNLSKGNVGEAASTLLGSLLVTGLQMAAMSRSDVAEDERPDFGIVIDEFQNYSTPAVATFLSEARKYRTHLVLSHQFRSQLDDSTRDAVTGNVGSMIVYQVGADDAEFYANQLGGHVQAEHLRNLPKYHAYCRLLIDGMPSQPFSMTTLKPPTIQHKRAEIIRRLSRQKYSRPIAAVDQQVKRGMGVA